MAWYGAATNQPTALKVATWTETTKHQVPLSHIEQSSDLVDKLVVDIMYSCVQLGALLAERTEFLSSIAVYLTHIMFGDPEGTAEIQRSRQMSISSSTTVQDRILLVVGHGGSMDANAMSNLNRLHHWLVAMQMVFSGVVWAGLTHGDPLYGELSTMRELHTKISTRNSMQSQTSTWTMWRH